MARAAGIGRTLRTFVPLPPSNKRSTLPNSRGQLAELIHLHGQPFRVQTGPDTLGMHKAVRIQDTVTGEIQGLMWDLIPTSKPFALCDENVWGGGAWAPNPLDPPRVHWSR